VPTQELVHVDHILVEAQVILNGVLILDRHLSNDSSVAHTGKIPNFSF
jgi:hypothetical protein